jgi:hypothetical protein
MMIGSINKNVTFTFLLVAALATMIIIPIQYAKAATYTDPVTGKTIQYPDMWTPVQSKEAQFLNAVSVTHGNLVFFDDSNGIPLATYGSVPASDPNSISNSMTSVTGTPLLNSKDITLASGKPALQFDYYYQPVMTQTNGDLGVTFAPAGNQLYIGGIAIIENGILYAVTYSPEIAQNNADYMTQIMDMANSL